MPELSLPDQSACIEFLRDLVRTPSHSGQEAAVASRVAEEMRRVGFDQVYTDGVGNVIGRLGIGSGSRLLFNAHMDTVAAGNLAAWHYDPFAAVVEDGVLYGRGAADTKAALAAMIYSAKLLAASSRSLKGELIMAAVVQEEPCEGMAMRAIVEEGGLWPSFVILGEPSDLQVAVGQRGRIELRVVTQGQACHASTPELGDNALVAASKVIFGVELLASQLGEDPVLGKGSIAVTGIRCSADSHNVVPDRCELALAEVRQIMERERVKGVVTVADYEHTTYTGHVSRGQEFYPPWLMAYDAPLVKTVARSLEKALGSRPRLKVWRFSTDGTYTRGIAGIPTVGFGPGEERLAHTANEHVRVADVLAAVDGYAQIGRDLLGRR
jgi:putative selenium metabolism hydrolase